jgi:hypothetical protein
LDPQTAKYFPIVFPFFFATLWLLVTTFLGFMSGWHVLMSQYPNRDENPVLRINRQSGSMGLGVSMNGILNLSVCHSGLRIGMMRLFGPFWRDFFVPWYDVTVVRRKGLFGEQAELQFGHPQAGRLTISAHVANRLARASAGYWPEQGAFPAETHRRVAASVAKSWAIRTGIASLFFTAAPRLMAPKGDHPSSWPFCFPRSSSG